MRIIHSRKRVWDKDYAFINNFTLLVWILSILKWKQDGNEMVLYTDEETLNNIKYYGFENLYDEINTELLSNEENYKDIDLYCFWAMPKMLSYKYETFELNNDVVIADTDVVPMSDISRFWRNCNVAVWSNKEYVEFKSIYPDLNTLPIPDGYKFPKWYTGKAKPLNTGIIHINDKKVIKVYLDEVFKLAIGNHKGRECPNWVTMCNAEQRTLGELVKHLDLSYQVVQPINQGLFNRNAFHTHGYKAHLKGEKKVQFNCNLLTMIKSLDESTFNKLIDKELFTKEKEYLEAHAYKVPYVKELEQYFK